MTFDKTRVDGFSNAFIWIIYNGYPVRDSYSRCPDCVSAHETPSCSNCEVSPCKSDPRFIIGKQDMESVEFMTSGYPEKHMEFCSKIQLKVSITAPVYEWINMIDLGLLSIPDGTIQVEPAPDALFNQIGYVISQDNFQKQPEMERFCETHSNIRYIVECMNSISQIHAPHESQLAALRHMCPMSFLETKNLSFTYKDMIYMFQKMSRRSPIWEPDFRLWVQKDVPYSDEFIMSYKF